MYMHVSINQKTLLAEIDWAIMTKQIALLVIIFTICTLFFQRNIYIYIGKSNQYFLWGPSRMTSTHFWIFLTSPFSYQQFYAPYAMRRILKYDRSEPNCLELISYQKLLLLLFQVIVNCDTIHMSLMGVCEVWVRYNCSHDWRDNFPFVAVAGMLLST